MANFVKYRIKEWSASYYQNETKTWLYGALHINIIGVIFTESKSNSEKLHIKFHDIAEVKKTTTGLIFRALVIVTNSGMKFWVSSLPDQNSVFNTICYFKRSQVLSCGPKTKPEKSRGGGTEMGKKLLNVAYDSQNTLSNAANMLQQQGDQLDSATVTLADINNDLDVADNILSGLEMWIGRWTIPQEYSHVDPLIVTNDQLSEDVEHEILYTKLEMNKMNTQNLGLLRICSEGLYILTEKQKLVHHYKWTDVSRVRVISMWEMVVSRFLIGQPDLSYSIVFSSLFSVLKLLDKRLRSKVEYSQEAFRQMEEPHLTTSSQPQADEKKQLKEYRWRTSSEDITPKASYDYQSESDQSTSRQQVTTATKSKEIVSDQEVTELCSVLSDLKSLALEVQKETDVQNEKLEKMTNTVQETDIRVKETDKRVKKLL